MTGIETERPADTPGPVQAPESPADARPARQLVADDNDVVGLLAFSLQTLSERDWRAAFETRSGRQPTEEEFAVFLIGETTDRRAAGYRQRAEALLGAHQDARDPGPPELPRATNLFPDFAMRSRRPSRGAMGLTLPAQTQPGLAVMGKYALLLLVLVGVLAVLVNFAKSSFFAD